MTPPHEPPEQISLETVNFVNVTPAWEAFRRLHETWYREFATVRPLYCLLAKVVTRLGEHRRGQSPPLDHAAVEAEHDLLVSFGRRGRSYFGQPGRVWAVAARIV